MATMPAISTHVGPHVPAPLSVAEARRLDGGSVNMPLSGNRSGWQTIRCRLPEGDMLVLVTKLRRIGRLIHHWCDRLTVVSSRPIPLCGEVMLVFDTTTLERILRRGRVAIVRRVFAVVLTTESMQAPVAMSGWASPACRTVPGGTVPGGAPTGDISIPARAGSCLAGGRAEVVTTDLLHRFVAGWLNCSSRSSITDSHVSGSIRRLLCEPQISRAEDQHSGGCYQTIRFYETHRSSLIHRRAEPVRGGGGT